MAAFLVNVGANSQHPARARLHADGSFDFLPIPEDVGGSAPMLRYADIPGLAGLVPASWRKRNVHLDPDLVSDQMSYGDNCSRIPRAFALRRAKPGDSIIFIARLHAPDGKAGFYLVGRLEVAGILKEVNGDPGPGWWDANAHVRRGRALGRWDAFSVFAGGAGSGLLAKAVPFGRQQAEQVFGLDWEWADQTPLQVIGAHTRSVRRLEGQAAQELLDLASSPLRLAIPGSSVFEPSR
jgi:hypothetical protein